MLRANEIAIDMFDWFDLFLWLKLQNLSPVKRAGLIQDAVSREFGTHVSKMYLAMSNAYEALENYQEASKVLKNGIEVGAQPVEYLEDELKWV